MIIAINGKIESGKDTVGNIINYLLYEKVYKNVAQIANYEDFPKDNNGVTIIPYFTEQFQIKKFADSLKDIVCILLGCTREQLENREFKEKELGKEWWVWKRKDNMLPKFSFNNQDLDTDYWDLIKLTPRKLLQLLGTECGRNIIHPNIWVNALMNDYIATYTEDDMMLPDWIITDMRFPNELEAVKDRDGITIRVNKSINIKVGDVINYLYGDRAEEIKTLEKAIDSCDVSNGRSVINGYYVNNDDIKSINGVEISRHESETALDNATFDYTIDNNGTIEELVEKVKEILINEKII